MRSKRFCGIIAPCGALVLSCGGGTNSNEAADAGADAREYQPQSQFQDRNVTGGGRGATGAGNGSNQNGNGSSTGGQNGGPGSTQPPSPGMPVDGNPPGSPATPPVTPAPGLHAQLCAALKVSDAFLCDTFDSGAIAPEWGARVAVEGAVQVVSGLGIGPSQGMWAGYVHLPKTAGRAVLPYSVPASATSVEAQFRFYVPRDGYPPDVTVAKFSAPTPTTPALALRVSQRADGLFLTALSTLGGESYTQTLTNIGGQMGQWLCASLSLNTATPPYGVAIHAGETLVLSREYSKDVLSAVRTFELGAQYDREGTLPGTDGNSSYVFFDNVRHHPQPPALRSLTRHLTVLGVALFSALGCRKSDPSEGDATRQHTSALEAAPMDHVRDGELAPGTDHAFGLVLPAGTTLTGQFVDVVYATVQCPTEKAVNFFRPRIPNSLERKSGEGYTWAGVRFGDLPGRVFEVKVSPGPNLTTHFETRDVTPKSAANLPDEPARWKAAGLRPNGQVIDPTRLQ